MRELSHHILDILENSLAAGASQIVLQINEDTAQNRLTIRVADNGRGMDAETLRRVSDPFFTTRTTRHVGLGIPLFKAAAERCNGGLTISSQVGQGTEIVATFQLDHIDRAPLGDIKSTLLGAILFGKACDLHFSHRYDDHEFELDTAEIRSVMGDVPLDHPLVRQWLAEYIREGYEQLYGEH